MTRWILATVAALSIMSTPSSAVSESLYVAAVDTLSADGKYSREYLRSTTGGVTMAECELRKAVWWKEHGPGFEAAIAQLAAEGMHTEIRVSCVPKP